VLSVLLQRHYLYVIVQSESLIASPEALLQILRQAPSAIIQEYILYATDNRLTPL
jgi:hypothetical protein